MSPKQSDEGQTLSKDQVERYLARIGYAGSTEVSAHTLRELQLAHLYSIPFENLDISAGRYIRLELDRLFDKIVNERRGGFCYELNGLFAAMLRRLGFAVDQLAAGVANKTGAFGPKFDHLTLLVHLAEPYLADVGFGDSFLAPLPFVESEDGSVDPAGVFRLQRAGETFQLEKHSDDGWQPQYQFDLKPHDLSEYVEMCHYQQTSPNSHFTQGRICSLARPDGRITLSELRLITTMGTVRTERDLASEEEVAAVLRESFGVVLSPDAASSSSAS